jgi:ribosome-binding protein aMBF1 (putative translation factor)
MQRDLSPRCGKPVIPYETPGRPIAGEYCGYGPLVRSAREASGLTPAQLAAAAGVSSARVVIWWELEWSYPGRSAAVLERVLGIRLPGPRCGRPGNHGGRCRSAAAVARYREQAAAQRPAA